VNVVAIQQTVRRNLPGAGEHFSARGKREDQLSRGDYVGMGGQPQIVRASRRARNQGNLWRTSDAVPAAEVSTLRASMADTIEPGGHVEEEPLVTVITPTYNHEAYIGQCIESVLSQTYPHWEQIIVDDGSTDRTHEIVKGYRDSRIVYVREEHKGVFGLASAYNRALNMSKGQLIAILEGDDFWPPTKLEKQVVAFREPSTVLSWGIGIYVDKDGKPVGGCAPFRREVIPGKDAMRKLLIGNFATPTVTVMVRKTALLPEGFIQPRGAPYVDYATWFLLARRGDFRFIREVLGYWRIHSGQTSRRLWVMRRGDFAVYHYLWRSGMISLPLFVGLLFWGLAKHLVKVGMGPGVRLTSSRTRDTLVR
jgi:glycosyltransferase involved in cell wall biosynthesis